MNFWLLLTELGEEKAYLALVPFIYFVVDRKFGWRLFCALLLSILTVITLKNFLKLPRPPEYLWKAPASGYGFPSGHTAVSSTFWSSLALRIRKAWFTAFAIILMLLIGVSRIELGVHYVRDVLGGLLVGITVGFLAYSVNLNVSGSLKLLGVVSASVIILLLHPLIGHYTPKMSGYLLGFGVAHVISTDFLNFELPDDSKLRFFLFLIAMPFLFLVSVEQNPFLYPVLSFLGCFVPNYVGSKVR